MCVVISSLSSVVAIEFVMECCLLLRDVLSAFQLRQFFMFVLCCSSSVCRGVCARGYESCVYDLDRGCDLSCIYFFDGCLRGDDYFLCSLA